MKDFNVTCDDGWKSKTVQAADKTEAAKMLWMDVEEHMKQHPEVKWPADEAGKLAATTGKVQEVMATPAM